MIQVTMKKNAVGKSLRVICFNTAGFVSRIFLITRVSNADSRASRMIHLILCVLGKVVKSECRFGTNEMFDIYGNIV